VKLVVADCNCYGENRPLLNRARISPIWPNGEMWRWGCWSAWRVGALVVSVPLDPTRSERRLSASTRSLAAAILEHLHNEPARRQITEAAYHYLTTELAWHPIVARILQRALTKQRTCQGVAL
jgi:hypothetical protein